MASPTLDFYTWIIALLIPLAACIAWGQSPLTLLLSQSTETRTLCVEKCVLGDYSHPLDLSQTFPFTLYFINFPSSFPNSLLLWMLSLFFLHFFRVPIIFPITIFTHCFCFFLFSQITIWSNSSNSFSCRSVREEVWVWMNEVFQLSPPKDQTRREDKQDW